MELLVGVGCGVKFGGWKINKTEWHLMMTVREIGHKLTNSCAPLMKFIQHFSPKIRFNSLRCNCANVIPET